MMEHKESLDRVTVTEPATCVLSLFNNIYSDEVQRAFGPGLAPGMNRIAIAIGQAYARDKLHWRSV
jgi:hypothetical protein